MRIQIIAIAFALAAAPSAFAGDPPSKAYDTPPDWVSLPDPRGLWVLMPLKARERGRSGSAVIQCEVLPQGTLEGCELVSEKPAGGGFGEAALLIAPSFAMRPAMKDGKPVRAKVRIPLRFENPGPSDHEVANPISIVGDPVWDVAPGFADVATVWPKKAKVDAAHVSLRCGIAPDGALKHCEVTSETPKGDGFGVAAIGLASKFRLRVPPGSTTSLKNVFVNVPVHFNNPALNTPRAVVEPKWIRGADPAKVQAIYPPGAADTGVKSGKGFADCTVGPDGRLVDCKPAGGVPDGLGFAEAAVAVASVMQMNPWTEGGGPVDGVQIRLPIAFNLAPDAKSPSTAKP